MHSNDGYGRSSWLATGDDALLFRRPLVGDSGVQHTLRSQLAQSQAFAGPPAMALPFWSCILSALKSDSHALITAKRKFTVFTALSFSYYPFSRTGILSDGLYVGFNHQLEAPAHDSTRPPSQQPH